MGCRLAWEGDEVSDSVVGAGSDFTCCSSCFIVKRSSGVLERSVSLRRSPKVVVGEIVGAVDGEEVKGAGGEIGAIGVDWGDTGSDG